MANPFPFKPADLVYMRTTVVKPGQVSKLLSTYKGPFELIELVGNTNARLRDLKTGRNLARLIHVNRLKRCYSRDSISDRIDVLPTGEVRWRIDSPLADSSSGPSTAQAINQASETLAAAELVQRDPCADTTSLAPVRANSSSATIEVQDNDQQPDTSHDTDRYFAASRISKQRMRGRTKQFLVHWRADRNARPPPPTWTDENMCSHALIDSFYTTHTRQGQLRANYRRSRN
jgi:hypothetical protein